MDPFCPIKGEAATVEAEGGESDVVIDGCKVILTVCRWREDAGRTLTEPDT